jgi:hypothetical protein
LEEIQYNTFLHLHYIDIKKDITSFMGAKEVMNIFTRENSRSQVSRSSCLWLLHNWNFSAKVPRKRFCQYCIQWGKEEEASFL